MTTTYYSRVVNEPCFLLLSLSRAFCLGAVHLSFQRDAARDLVLPVGIKCVYDAVNTLYRT